MIGPDRPDGVIMDGVLFGPILYRRVLDRAHGVLMTNGDLVTVIGAALDGAPWILIPVDEDETGRRILFACFRLRRDEPERIVGDFGGCDLPALARAQIASTDVRLALAKRMPLQPTGKHKPPFRFRAVAERPARPAEMEGITVDGDDDPPDAESFAASAHALASLYRETRVRHCAHGEHHDHAPPSGPTTAPLVFSRGRS